MTEQPNTFLLKGPITTTHLPDADDVAILVDATGADFAFLMAAKDGGESKLIAQSLVAFVNILPDLLNASLDIVLEAGRIDDSFTKLRGAETGEALLSLIALVEEKLGPFVVGYLEESTVEITEEGRQALAVAEAPNA